MEKHELKVQRFRGALEKLLIEKQIVLWRQSFFFCQVYAESSLKEVLTFTHDK